MLYLTFSICYRFRAIIWSVSSTTKRQSNTSAASSSTSTSNNRFSLNQFFSNPPANTCKTHVLPWKILLELLLHFLNTFQHFIFFFIQERKSVKNSLVPNLKTNSSFYNWIAMYYYEYQHKLMKTQQKQNLHHPHREVCSTFAHWNLFLEKYMFLKALDCAKLLQKWVVHTNKEDKRMTTLGTL